MSNPAETYERYMVPVLFAPSAERMVALARLRPGARVLDVGCGTGSVARRAAPLVGPTGQLVGLDLSPGMLAVARAAASREGLSIDWREGRARRCRSRTVTSTSCCASTRSCSLPIPPPR
jgi:2-polyprenyl-3-methyl-5-hydroxy-6-metoxy-1,4-benzoquinol methylase